VRQICLNFVSLRSVFLRRDIFPINWSRFCSNVGSIRERDHPSIKRHGYNVVRKFVFILLCGSTNQDDVKERQKPTGEDAALKIDKPESDQECAQETFNHLKNRLGQIIAAARELNWFGFGEF
jgi:hypothetical protein